MKKIEFWLHRFVFVYGLVMLSTFFMCLLFNPTSELPVVRFFGREDSVASDRLRAELLHRHAAE